ncbi:MAG: Asp/Glu/hydantoin racemase [Butyrivibrio sp.]|nr:aspartate/glutamate racemase family protein [Butyrivibrio sp.]MBQ8032151.1 Asp/Glu/hydantoin racemase [Butyrivibrio sp.]MBR1641230.1 Asp/Glu/hydantoin racemase [Butyrivibrio sp.]
MKIGVVYTSTTPELIEDVNREIKSVLGDDIEIYAQEDPSILAEVRDAGYVTQPPAARLITMFMKAAENNCEAVLNACSSVGEVADCVQSAAAYLGMPIVRIDEEMCRDAARKGSRIGVMATLPTTLIPTCNTIERVARECNRHVTIKQCLVENAFGLDQEQFRERMSRSLETIAADVDVVVLAQGSMAYCADFLSSKYGIPVLSSPSYGAMALKNALIKKGVING